MSEPQRDTSGDDDALSDSLAAAVAALPPAPATSAESLRDIMTAVHLEARARKRERTLVRFGAIAALLLVGVTLLSRSRAMPWPIDSRPLVEFRLAAPTARRVTLVGDFNAWNARATPLHVDTSGTVWIARIPLAEGRYQYAFVLDGDRWLADPEAARASPDDFARPNSVVVVSSQLAQSPSHP